MYVQGVFLLSSSFIEEKAQKLGASKGLSGLLGGAGGGIVQAYTTMAPGTFFEIISSIMSTIMNVFHYKNADDYKDFSEYDYAHIFKLFT